ncbi:hypothetical protein BaRGS_00010851 [Batillaria attramentaria]|uniref:Uncharacterized protein n=1 Tax=Batillaria attramentaria TaxID=370345 RepID=A0ABD0LF35_9CAEN
MRWCRQLLDAVGRRKPWDARSLQQTDFRRCLTVLDIVGLGVGCCAAVGVYVIAAHVTRNEAGPASVLSVILASVAALLAGLCHAELAGRLPRAGTGYTYCYVTLGELCAFVVGWGILLEQVLTAAVAAKAWAQYLDFMLNDTLSSQVEEVASWQLPEPFGAYPDVLAFVVMLVASLSAFLSVKAFSVISFVLTVLSGFVLLAFVCVGYFHVQEHNWTQPPGFFANGFRGMLSGAALLMAVFAGLDQVVGTSQETREPCRHVPSAVPLTTALIFLAMLLATTALTLACPWQDLTDRAPIARAFETKGIYAANHVIGVGALLGLSAAMMGALYHPPRLLHSMAGDGLMPRWLGRTSLSATPVVGSLLTGLMAAGVALLLDFHSMVEMLAIATVLQFLTSAIIVLYVRYQPDTVGLVREYSDLDLSLGEGARPESPKLLLMANGDLHVHYDGQRDAHSALCKSHTGSRSRTSNQTEFTETSAICGGSDDACRRVVRSGSNVSSLVQLSACTKLVPDAGTWQTTRYLLLVFLLAATCLSATSLAWPSQPQSSWWAVTLACVSVALLVAAGLGIARQPQSEARLHFKAPYVPLLPLLSLVLSMLLLAALPAIAWLRFAVWTAVGKYSHAINY